MRRFLVARYQNTLYNHSGHLDKALKDQNFGKGIKMDKQAGLIHIYCGNGKGKTTCGMGLCTRAAGYGYKVLIYQFMKNNQTSERKVLETIDNITFVDGLDFEKFSFKLSSEEKEERKLFYESQFRKITRLAESENYDVLFLDEIIYAVSSDLFEETILLDYLCRKPKGLEVILTGQDPSKALIDVADYVSSIHKVKHPFDKGIMARNGIER